MTGCNKNEDPRGVHIILTEWASAITSGDTLCYVRFKLVLWDTRFNLVDVLGTTARRQRWNPRDVASHWKMWKKIQRKVKKRPRRMQLVPFDPLATFTRALLPLVIYLE